MQYQVVTRVPDHREAGETGNMAMAPDVYVEVEEASPDNGWQGKVLPIGTAIGLPSIVLALRRPVFTLGEVLIVDDDGREVAGHGRKAAKWDVSVETFDTPEQAVERARLVETLELDGQRSGPDDEDGA